jgi:acyl dehydratase
MGRSEDLDTEQADDSAKVAVDSLRVGQVLRARRHVTEADIAAFAALVGDEGSHHRQGAERIMAHGLLTASLATKIGGRIDFIAQHMSWHFLRPVWAGDTISAEVGVRAVREARSGTGLELDVVIVNQHGDEVLRGESTGVVRGQPGD